MSVDELASRLNEQDIDPDEVSLWGPDQPPGLPPQTYHSLQAYAQQHIPQDGFLEAVLSNNLIDAVLKADSDNLRALARIVKYCWQDIPHVSWGSPEKYKAWIRRTHE
jgi:hypothetical protein